MLLWRELRARPGGYKFRRQHPISSLVLDFACLGTRVAIEIDGIAPEMGDKPERDERRDAWLRAQGFAVLRLLARDVLRDVEGAVDAIVALCDERSPLHHAAGRRGSPPRPGEVCES